MKKFLLLSFLMVWLLGAISYAQTRQINHYTNNPYNNWGVSYSISNPDPSGYIYGSSYVNNRPHSDVDFTLNNVTVEFLDYSNRNKNNLIYGGDGAFVDMFCDFSQIRTIYYSFEVWFTNGDYDVCDIIDTYN